jgi:tetratricopeptide (TPR) repeat protein
MGLVFAQRALLHDGWAESPQDLVDAIGQTAQACLDANSGFWGCYQLRGHALEYSGTPEQVLAAYRESARLSGDIPGILGTLVPPALVRAGRPEEAIELVDELLARYPNEPQAPNMRATLAWAHSFAGRHEKALGILDQVLTEPPTPILQRHVHHLIRAVVLAEMGRIEEARQAYETAVELRPGYAKRELHELFRPSRAPEYQRRFMEALTLAGLP